MGHRRGRGLLRLGDGNNRTAWGKANGFAVAGGVELLNILEDSASVVVKSGGDLFANSMNFGNDWIRGHP